MKLSVIVVNHNMCALLKQSLNTLIRACRDIDNELIVVDDASTDRSVAMLQKDFHSIKLIVNDTPQGMAKARNQALEVANGEYVLLVNADTISGKKTVEQALEFMEYHADAGGVGVRMVTPLGRFLRESRMGFTKSWEALLRVTGLVKYFPKSRLYRSVDENRFEDDEFATAEVDVINGAFMLLRSSAVAQVGGNDERFRNFGHDIDLSFRIRLAGYKNYYYPRTYILNFRKQLQPKFSWAYIKDYYGAMVLFTAKYLFRMPEIKMPSLMPQLFTAKYEIEQQ